MNRERKNLLVFGYGLAVILTFLGVRLGMKHGWGAIPICFLIVAGGFILITAINVYALKPFYQKWMKGAHAIGTVMTAIILSLLFYGVFGVVGIILRILRKDLLDRKIEPSKKSYWHQREDVKFDPKHYIRQF